MQEQDDHSKKEHIAKLAKRIKQLRTEKGHMNYETFAIEHGISRSQYWRYEKGEDLRFSSLVRVVHALGVTLEEFFSEGFE
jgi:transcriptional regulator with XRE-family HTH domain